MRERKNQTKKIEKTISGILVACLLVIFWTATRKAMEKDKVHALKPVGKEDTKPLETKIEPNKEIENGESYIYKWKDNNGNYHFSNTNFPANNKTLEIIKDEKPYSRQTKFKNHGGAMLIPVEVENKGHKETINLIFDTGCGITQLHPDVINRLNPRKTNKGKSHVADGREINTTYYEIDSIKIGSIEEVNFMVGTPDELEHKRGIDGLLGMNFLRRHPFEIDKKAGVIIWE